MTLTSTARYAGTFAVEADAVLQACWGARVVTWTSAACMHAGLDSSEAMGVPLSRLSVGFVSLDRIDLGLLF
jgi:hypothetical protein